MYIAEWLADHFDYQEPEVEPDRPTDWPYGSESEPLEECSICGCGFSASFEGIVCPDCVKHEDNRD